MLGAKFWFSSTEKNLLAVQEQCLQNKPFANCCSPFVVASAQQELRPSRFLLLSCFTGTGCEIQRRL
ncbi:hypothetical protein [Fervidibacter sacchari]